MLNDIVDLDREFMIRDRAHEELLYRKKIPVAILGATGTVGQKLIELLLDHPWFIIQELCASEKSIGKTFIEAVQWRGRKPLPKSIQDIKISRPEEISSKIVFSAVDSAIAEKIDPILADRGCIVFSFASTFRMDPKVPLFIAEVNYDHLKHLKSQGFKNGGMIISKPNCTVIGLCLALKPLVDAFGVSSVRVVTMQSISGAGYPGTPSLDILDNVLPYISGEEEKVENEPKKIFGTFKDAQFTPWDGSISATCLRVPTTEGHVESLSFKLHKKVAREEVINAWQQYTTKLQELHLPSAPQQLIHYSDDPLFPQPKLHTSLDKGMAVSIGRLRECSVLDYSCVILSHNLIRGAAGGAICALELLVKEGYVFW